MPTLDVGIDARKAKAGANEFDQATKKVKRGAGDVDRSTGKNVKSFNSLGGSMKKVVVGMIGIAAAYKGLRFAISSVKEFAAFEMGLANVSTMLDETSMKYMPQYEQQLKKMAIEFGQSTDTLSKGLYDILSASISADKAIGVLRVSSKAAIAGLTDTGTAADALTTILNSYGLEAEEAAKIGDILFATVKAGKITFGELAGSIGKVSALAAASGMTIEELSAAISTMTRAGIQSDIAMTSIKGILTTILSPTKQNIEAAKKFGIELNTTTLQTMGLTGILEKLEGATQEEISAIFTNVRALTGIAGLRQDLTGFISDQEKATNSLGKQEEAYEKIADKTDIKIKRMAESWKALKVAIGEEAAPAIDNMSAAMVRMGPVIGGLVRHIGSDIPDAITEMYFQTILARKKVLYAWARIDLTGVLDDEALKREVESLKKIIEGIQGVTKVQEELKKATEGTGDAFEGLTDKVKNAFVEFSKSEETWEDTRDFLLGLSNSVAVTAESIIGIVPASEEFTDVLTKLNKEIESVRIEIKEFEKTDIEKQIAQFERLEESLTSPTEILKYREEIKKLEKALIELGKLEEAKELKEKEVEYIDHQAKAYRRLYDDLKDWNEGSYDFRLYLLGREKIKYEEFIKDKVLLDKWHAERKAYLDAKRAIESENFFAGFQAGTSRAEEDILTWGEIGNNVAETMNNSFADALMQMTEAGGNWKDAMTGFALSVGQAIRRMMAEQIAAQVMVSAVSPFTSALVGGITGALTGGIGGLFGGAAASPTVAPSISSAAPAITFAEKGMTIRRMAKGDILSRPTIFPMSNGSIGLGGEAGNEALMPLGRDAQGRLGVRTNDDDGNRGTPIKIINVMDYSQVQEYLGTGDGERMIVNIMRRNATEIQEVVS